MFSVKVKVFTAPSVPLVGDSPRRMVLYPLSQVLALPKGQGMQPPSSAQNRYAIRLADQSKVFVKLCGIEPSGDNSQ